MENDDKMSETPDGVCEDETTRVTSSTSVAPKVTSGFIPQGKEEVDLDDFDHLHRIARKSDVRRLIEHLPTSPFLNDFSMVDNGKLGEGANGFVRKCKHKRTGQECAVKCIVVDEKSSPSKLRHLNNEIYYHMLCRHPHIVSLYFVYLEKRVKSTVYYFVMELLSGGELFFRIKREKRFTEEDARLTVKNLASAIEYLHHMGIAHRDLKPENLVLTGSECHPSDVKIIDFGYARTGAMSTPLGSGFYISPEIVEAYRARVPRSKGEVVPFTYDTQTDMWSLGIIVYILLTGLPPFPRERGKQWYRDMKLQTNVMKAKYSFPESINVSDQAKDLVGGMMQTDPRKRLTASQVLCHPWIIGSPDLKTRMLDSPGRLQSMSEDDVMAVKRDIDAARENTAMQKQPPSSSSSADLIKKLRDKREAKKVCMRGGVCLRLCMGAIMLFLYPSL
eukprot:m.26292 g.26292  ORF g.26292 m.26292 type:complete len:447 (+) comp5844_c0_seq2:133-1473(+)